MIDIGPSSSGMISLLREALPAGRRHEVVFRKLRMSLDDAVNVFDTQLGMQAPNSGERQFLVNFLSLVCGGGTELPSAAMRGLIAESVDQAYREHDDARSPRRYARGEEPEADRVLEEMGFEGTGDTSWWEVTNLLMESGRPHEASLAQRHAVPTLADLVAASQAEQVASLYESAGDAETGQSAMNSFRCAISEAARDYPILASRTRFSVGSARMVALDLMDVSSGGGSPAAKSGRRWYTCSRGRF